MNWRRPAWWPLYRRERHHSQVPGTALSQELRIRLTLWYWGVLGAALVLFSVALYFGAQYFLLHPFESDAQAHVNQYLGERFYRVDKATSLIDACLSVCSLLCSAPQCFP